MNDATPTGTCCPLTMQQLKEHWGMYLALGISLIILGTLAIVYTCASTIFSIVYLGILLIISGISESIQAFKFFRAWSNFFLHLFLCILYLTAGILMIKDPALNAVSLTLLLALFFIISGIAKTVFALTKKVPHAPWIAINGIITFILGVLIWYQWPSSGFWVIGTFIGIDTLLSGWTLVMLALMGRKA